MNVSAISCARPSTLRLSLSKIEYFVLAGIAGFAAGVTVRLVAPPIAVIWNTCGGLVSAITVQPLRIRVPAAVKFVPAPVRVFPLMAIVPVV